MSENQQNQHHNDANRPAFLMTPPILSKKEISKQQVAAEHSFDNFDGVGVGSSDYSSSIASPEYNYDGAGFSDMQNSEGSSSKVNRLPNISIPALHPRSSLEQITPTTSAFQTGSASSSPQYQTSPAHSATAAALASATVRSNLKIGRVRVVESTHGGIVPVEHVESQEALPAQFQKTLPLQAMQGEEGFATGNSVQSSVTNSIYDASKTSPQSAIQGNIEDEDEDDDYGRDDDIKDEDYGKSSHPYGKGPFGTVHTPPLLGSSSGVGSATTANYGSAPSINPVTAEYASTNSDSSSSYVHVDHPHTDSLNSSFQNLSVGVGSDETRQLKAQLQAAQSYGASSAREDSHHYKQIFADESFESLPAPDIGSTPYTQDYTPQEEGTAPSDNLMSYYYDDNYDGVDIAPYPPQHILKQYNPKLDSALSFADGVDPLENLGALSPRKTTHPTLHVENQGTQPPESSSIQYSQHQYDQNEALKTPRDHSKSVTSFNSSVGSSSVYTSNEAHLGHHTRSSVVSTASSGILDSSGGISKLPEPASSTASARDVTGINTGLVIPGIIDDDASIYSEISNATVRGVIPPIHGVSVDPNVSLQPQNVLPRTIVQGPTVPGLAMGYEAPLNTKEGGSRMVSRTADMLMKRQASGGQGPATINISDNFKNEHMPAPVIVDEQSGEPLVFYPASIPVELKLPPLLSKKNQLKVLKARAAAQKNRPKTFVVPTPPVWTVDPTVIPEDLQELRRSVSGTSTLNLNRRQSMGASSILADPHTTIKIKRRSSSGTFSMLNLEDDPRRKSTGHKRSESQGTIDGMTLEKEREAREQSRRRIEGQGEDEDGDVTDSEQKDGDNAIRLKKRKSAANFGEQSGDVVSELDVVKQRNVNRKSHARKASTVSKMSYVDGDKDAWDDGEEYEEEALVDEDEPEVGNDSQDIDTGHFLNDEIDSDCATLHSDDEYQDEMNLSDEGELTFDDSDEEVLKASAIGNDRNVDDFAFTSFDPNTPITDRGLLGGSISYSSGIFPTVGIQPTTLVEELELRKAEKKARIQKVYYDSTTGNAIAADMYGRNEPASEQLIRQHTSGHPLDDRHNKTLLELQTIANDDYVGELQFRRNIQNAHEIERQIFRYGGANGSKAALSQIGLLNESLSAPLEDNPNESLKERRARLKQKKKDDEAAAAELARLNAISVEGEGGLPDDEEEPPGETLAERRARIKKKKRLMKEKSMQEAAGVLHITNAHEDDLVSTTTVEHPINGTESIVNDENVSLAPIAGLS